MENTRYRHTETATAQRKHPYNSTKVKSHLEQWLGTKNSVQMKSPAEKMPVESSSHEFAIAAESVLQRVEAWADAR
jgi:hypothetical protein